MTHGYGIMFVKNLRMKKTKFKNISGLYTNTEHPFVNCGLGEYFDHLKGDDRKKNGKSFEDDYVKS